MISGMHGARVGGGQVGGWVGLAATHPFEIWLVRTRLRGKGNQCKCVWGGCLSVFWGKVIKAFVKRNSG